MSAAIRKIEGIAGVDVSLSGKFADVTLKAGNRVDPERIRQAIRESGFSPKEADVKVAGRIVERGGKLALEVSGLDDVVYLLVEHPEAKDKLAEAHKAAGKAVVVTGHLLETAIAPKPDAPRTLEIRHVTLETR